MRFLEDDDTEKVEVPFRYVSPPPPIWDMLRQEQISTKDFLLIAAIGGLVGAHTSMQKGIGCFASNKRLAEIIKGNPTHVSERLAHLKKQNQVIIVKYKGRRFIELAWSRTPTELKKLPGEYGNIIREAHKQLTKNIKESHSRPKKSTSAPAESDNSTSFVDFGSTRRSPSVQPEVDPSVQPEGDLNKSINLKDRIREEDPPRKSALGAEYTKTPENTAENTEKSPRRPSLRSGNGKGNCAYKENEARPEISSNKPALDSLRSSAEKENSGNKLNNGIKENSSISRSAPDSLRSSERELPKKRKPQIDEECARWANELKKHIQANNDIVDRFNKSTWAGHFLQLREQLGSDKVEDILEFFGRMIETGESDRLNMPTINSAKQFKERIVWISNLKRKREREIKNMLENNILPPHLRW